VEQRRAKQLVELPRQMPVLGMEMETLERRMGRTTVKSAGVVCDGFCVISVLVRR
jgi:hypothetical protein